MDLQLATIVVKHPSSPDPGSNLPDKFTVQFNPTEYTRTKGVQIAEIGVYGIDSPILQFVRGQNEKLTLDLFFDTTEFGMNDNVTSVTTKTEPFYQLVKQQRTTHAPPRVEFQWSKDLNFEAIVESITEKFTLFNPEGIPLRATLTVTFRQYRTLEQMVKDLQSADHSKRWVVEAGQTLNRIAGIAYGDPGLWRVIADYNGIDSPRRVAPGTVLLIPPLDQVREG
jgi:hypothetical protein